MRESISENIRRARGGVCVCDEPTLHVRQMVNLILLFFAAGAETARLRLMRTLAAGNRGNELGVPSCVRRGWGEPELRGAADEDSCAADEEVLPGAADEQRAKA